ncbi:MAG: hypothetical protein ABIK62_07435, partial [candidate division WOR-3 bacterium]
MIPSPRFDTGRWYWPLLVGLTLLHLVPLWIVRFLPLVDLPQHLAFVSILRNYHSPGSGYPDEFRLRLFPAHNALHLYFCYPLSLVLGIEGANQVFLSLYVVLMPLALFLLFRALRANRWLVLLGFLFIYNYNLLWGFVSSSMAIPLTLLLLALELNQLAAVNSFTGLRGVANWAVMAVLLVLIFLGHALFFLFAVVLFVVVLLFQSGWHLRTWVRLLALAPGLVLFGAWWQQQRPGAGLGRDLLMSLSPGECWA